MYGAFRQKPSCLVTLRRLSCQRPAMRIALLADAHGNFLALQAVLADLRTTSPDLVVNL